MVFFTYTSCPRESPKSAIFATQFSPTRMFLAAKSLWMNYKKQQKILIKGILSRQYFNLLFIYSTCNVSVISSDDHLVTCPCSEEITENVHLLYNGSLRAVVAVWKHPCKISQKCRKLWLKPHTDCFTKTSDHLFLGLLFVQLSQSQ